MFVALPITVSKQNVMQFQFQVGQESVKEEIMVKMKLIHKLHVHVLNTTSIIKNVQKMYLKLNRLIFKRLKKKTINTSTLFTGQLKLF